jgi:NADH-quinone oxidoreductase subunit C
MAMDAKYQPAVSMLQERCGAEVSEFRGEITCKLSPEAIADAARALRDEFRFDHLVDITAVDYWPQEEPRFHVVYHIRNLAETLVLCLRVPLDGNAPEISSIEGVYRGANWFEREVFDMFGIKFNGNSDLRRILMPHDWVGHPLRKDYPLGYEEVQFTFNFDQVSVRKPHPKE